jgi:hypothetical protein
MNNNNIDYTKVKAAVAKYVPKAIQPKVTTKTAMDSALRKPLKAHGKVCTGFTHPDFLNNDR